jgi:phage gp36-like protein
MYVTLNQLKAYLQEQLLAQGLDDSGENLVTEATFSLVSEAVERDVHGYLEGRYEVPFKTNVPNLVIHACLVLCAQAIYLRRGMGGDANPFSKAAESVRGRLSDVSQGKVQLSLQHATTQTAGAIVSGPVIVDGSGRLTL